MSQSNLPAFLYTGNETLFAVQLLFSGSYVEIFELTCERVIARIYLENAKISQDKNTSTLFRVVYDGKPFIFFSPFRHAIVSTIQALLSGEKLPDSTLTVPVIENLHQKILKLRGDEVVLINQMQKEEATFQYQSIASKVAAGILSLDQRKFELVERTNEFLVLATVKARGYLQKMQTTKTMELSEDEAAETEQTRFQASQLVVKPEEKLDESKQSDQLSYRVDDSLAMSPQQSDRSNKYALMQQYQNMELSASQSIPEVVLTRNQPPRSGLQRIETNPDVSALTTENPLTAQIATSLSKIEQKLQQKPDYEQLVRDVRRPVLVYKFMEGRKAFHQVQMFAPRETGKGAAFLTWADEKLVVDVQKPVSIDSVKSAKYIDLAHFKKGLASLEQKLSDKVINALQEIPFNVTKDNVFCLHGDPDDDRQVLVAVVEKWAGFEEMLNKLMELQKAGESIDK